MLARTLSEKDVANLAVKALTKEEQLVELLKGLHSKKDILRSSCFKVLHYISKKNPHTLYSKWDFFCQSAR